MTDLNKEREEFESDLAEHLIERDSNGFYLNDEIQNYWEKHLLKVQIKELKAELEKAKAQAVPDTHLLVPKEPVEDVVIWLLCEKDIGDNLSQAEYFYKELVEKFVEASESGAEG